MVKQIIETAIAQIEGRKQQEIANVRQRVFQEKIAPHNTEVDNLLRKALEEMQTAHAEAIAALTRTHEEKKAALTLKATKDKEDFSTATYAEAVAAVQTSADQTIAKLRALIAD